MKVVCFHNPNEENGYLSNWYLSKFIVDDITYSSMEQYMMYQKAILFKDEFTAKKILESKEPREQKKLGRLIKNFDEMINYLGISQEKK